MCALATGVVRSVTRAWDPRRVRLELFGEAPGRGVTPAAADDDLAWLARARSSTVISRPSARRA
jgi:hypothetical protein